VLAIVDDFQGDPAIAGERIDKSSDRTVADAFDQALGAADRDRCGDAPQVAGARLGEEGVIEEGDTLASQIGSLKERPQLGTRLLLAGAVGDLLDDAAELDLQAAR
jgi:hypothetical protein